MSVGFVEEEIRGSLSYTLALLIDLAVIDPGVPSILHFLIDVNIVLFAAIIASIYL